nr:RNA polymerase II degradation factor 1-like [Penaeus vannamei]
MFFRNGLNTVFCKVSYRRISIKGHSLRSGIPCDLESVERRGLGYRRQPSRGQDISVSPGAVQARSRSSLRPSPQNTADMKIFVAVLILGSVASSQALFFDLFKKESQVDPWTAQAADPWAQPADPWPQPASPWAKPSIKPVIKEVPIYIPYPKLEPVQFVKPFPVFKPEFVSAPIPLYKPQLSLPNKFFNFNANLEAQKQHYQQAQQQQYQEALQKYQLAQQQQYHQYQLAQQHYQQAQQAQQQQQLQQHHQSTTSPSTAYEAPEAHNH